jgi:hypothetical protein
MMIYLDIAAAIMVALFIWLVPVRRNGIPGLRGRGKLPPVPPPTHPGYVAPRPAPPDEMTGEPDGGHDNSRDDRLLAELDATWKPGYADEVTAQHQSRQEPD